MKIFELHYFQVFYVPAAVHVLSQTSIGPQIFGLFWNKDILQDWMSLTKSHCIFSNCAKYPVAGESDFTPSCQGGIPVIVSTAPFSCTLLFVICSLIFGTTAIRTWSCDCSSVVWRLSSWGSQSSGCADRARFSNGPGGGGQLELTHLIYLWGHPIKMRHRAGWLPDFKDKTTLVFMRHVAYLDHVSRIRYEIQLGLKI